MRFVEFLIPLIIKKFRCQFLLGLSKWRKTYIKYWCPNSNNRTNALKYPPTMSPFFYQRIGLVFRERLFNYKAVPIFSLLKWLIHLRLERKLSFIKILHNGFKFISVNFKQLMVFWTITLVSVNLLRINCLIQEYFMTWTT